MSHHIQRSLGTVIAAFLLVAPFAIAQENNAGTPLPLPPRSTRPLDLLRDKKAIVDMQMDVKAGIKTEHLEFRGDVIDKRKAMHADVKAALDAASTRDEKQAILMDARKDRAEFHMQVKTDAETMRASFKDQRGEVRDARRAQIAEHLSMVMHRLVNALERFDQILSRIDSRIEKLQSEGVDVSTALSASASASVSIDAAHVAVADAEAAIETAAHSETPRDHIEEVRVAVRAAVDAVKAAHEALKETLRAIKALVPGIPAGVGAGAAKGETNAEAKTTE